MIPTPTHLALTRGVSPAINICELTHLERTPIDLARAESQHAGYTRALEAAGCRLISLPADPQLPDSVFVEDCALVLDEIAVITRPGAESRRPETAAIAAALQPHRELAYIVEPGTLDGGDILVLGREVYVGISGRSNLAAIRQLGNLLEAYGYNVQGVPIRGCLHLKSAVTQVQDTVSGTDGLLLLNPEWVEPDAFTPWRWLAVDPTEPAAANALLMGETLIYPDQYPRTAARLTAAGLSVTPVAVGELIKAEGAVTCCSLIWQDFSYQGAE